MKINKISVRSFRAVGADGLDILFDASHTMIIGENNVGKSSILEATKKILKHPDATWSPEDWHGRDQEKTIEISIECQLDDDQMAQILTALGMQVTVSQFVDSFPDVLTCELRRTRYQTTLLFKLGELTMVEQELWLGHYDKTKSYSTGSLQGIDLKVAGGTKLIDAIRGEIATLMSGTNNQVKFSIPNRVDEAILDILSSSIVVIEEFREKPADKFYDFTISPTGRELASVLFKLKNDRRAQLRKYFAQIQSSFNRIFPALTLDVILEEDNVRILIEKAGVESTTMYLGAGVLQVLLILTHATSHGRYVLFMDSPESHLHPHILRRLSSFMNAAEGGQVIIITHSPYLVMLSKYSYVLRAIQVSNQTKLISCPKDVFSENDLFKLDQVLDVDSKEIFFARKILLVEGSTESGSLPIFADKLGYNLDENGVSVISVGGKGLFEIFVKLCEGFRIPYFVLADEDARPIIERLRLTYQSGRFAVLTGTFDQLLPEQLRNEANKYVGTSKARIGRFVANRIERTSIPRDIVGVIHSLQQLT